MKPTGKNYQAFEDFAKEMGATFSANPDDLSKEQRAFLENFAQSLRDMGGIDDLPLPPGERFHQLAQKHDLSMDDGDIEYFLTVELSKLLKEIKITKKTLASDTALRQQAIDQALERVFVGIEFARISKADQNELWESATEAASELLDNFNLGILKNPAVNSLRQDLMDIYEPFLLWMRTIRDGLLSLSEKDQKRIETHMKKMIELLNLCFKLSQAPMPSDPFIQKLLSSDDARNEGLLEYRKALNELEAIVPSRQKALRLLNAGRHFDNDW
ncbi:MAG: hypothetical protein PHT55_07720 [Spirochaetales bacterium]|nr:hypothetical protein [Spirochaetales bacterium]